jgi:predicted metal-dependent phosphotriesterase family hydrolase
VRDFLPRLRKAGLNADEIACLTSANIRRAFAE